MNVVQKFLTQTYYTINILQQLIDEDKIVLCLEFQSNLLGLVKLKLMYSID